MDKNLSQYFMKDEIKAANKYMERISILLVIRNI